VFNIFFYFSRFNVFLFFLNVFTSTENASIHHAVFWLKHLR